MTRGPVFDGKVVAITGAASGIGRACALGAANDGARVALIDRHGTQSVEAEIAAEAASRRLFAAMSKIRIRSTRHSRASRLIWAGSMS